MAAFVKSLAFMILVVTVSGLESRSHEREEHLVKVEFELPHVVGAGPFRLMGNTSALGNGNPSDAPLMDAISANYAVLYADLIAGETYSVSVLVDVCPCPHEAKVFKVIDADIEMGVWLGDKACNIACPPESTDTLMEPRESQSPKEEHLVKVEFELPHVVGVGPFRLMGNTSALGNGNPSDAPLMDPISSDYAVLYANLTAGETYSVSVYVDVCPCPYEPTVFKVHTDEDVEMGVWLGDKACNILCPQQSMHLDSIRSVV